MALPAFIIASHGYMAKESLGSLELILGYKVDNVGVISVTEGKSFDDALSEIKELYQSLDTSSGCLIFTDIFGGTPSNIATYLLIEKNNVEVITGFNLPIILEAILSNSKNASDCVEYIESLKNDSMINLKRKLKEENNGDQMDSY